MNEKDFNPTIKILDKENLQGILSFVIKLLGAPKSLFYFAADTEVLFLYIVWRKRAFFLGNGVQSAGSFQEV